MRVLVHMSPLLLLGLMALDHHGLVATSRHPAGIQTESELAIASRFQFQSLPFLHIKQ